MKSLLKRLALGAVLLSVGQILSCDLNEPTGRFFNSSAHPPQVGTLNIREIRNGQHIAGTVEITFTADSITVPISKVRIFIDGEWSMEISTPPYVFPLNTENYPQGSHVISIGVYEPNPDLGLYNIAEVPSILYSTTIVFDQARPTPIALISVVWDLQSRAPRLTWQASGDSNFYAYIIGRQANFPSPTLIDTVYDRSTTTYVDTSLHQIYGVTATYYVFVTNRVFTGSGNEMAIHFGETLPVIPNIYSYFPTRPITSPSRNEMYVMGSDSVYAVSTITNAILRRIKLTPSGFSYLTSFALAKDGSRLFVGNVQQRLLVLDVNTFDTVLTRTLSLLPSVMVAGRANRLYVADGQYINVLNANTGAFINRIAITYAGDMAISPDTTTLYVAQGYGQGLQPVYKIDIRTDSLRIELQSAPSIIRTMQLSSDGQRLYIGQVQEPPAHGYVSILDAQTLALTATIPTPGRLWDCWATPSHIYVSHCTTDPSWNCLPQGQMVAQYNASDLSLSGAWEFLTVPTTIVTSSDERYMYAYEYPTRTWIVPLQP